MLEMTQAKKELGSLKTCHGNFQNWKTKKKKKNEKKNQEKRWNIIVMGIPEGEERDRRNIWIMAENFLKLVTDIKL